MTEIKKFTGGEFDFEEAGPALNPKSAAAAAAEGYP